MSKERKLIRKYFKIKNPNGPGILKVVDLEDAINILNEPETEKDLLMRFEY